MEFKVQDIPLLFFAYLGIVSPYFLGLYWFDPKAFSSLYLWSNILLSISYSFPVFYLNMYISKWIWKILGRGNIFEKDFVNDIINICIACAQQQYIVLLYCLIRFGDNPLFKFYHFRNNTWFAALTLFIIIGLCYIFINLTSESKITTNIRKFIH
ncbi:MAG: hypothetical protein HY841_15700 [Bacteroidetes bacterium]|nr:hypothetical protein [Bacteroidota bacterium]